MRVDGHKDFVRDEESGAILNINSAEIEKNRKIKRDRRAIEQEIETLKQDVSDLKDLVKQLVEKL